MLDFAFKAPACEPPQVVEARHLSIGRAILSDALFLKAHEAAGIHATGCYRGIPHVAVHNFFFKGIASEHDKDASTQAEAVGGFAHNDCDCKDMTTAQMKTQTTFAGWDFAKTWSINATENDGYPMLREMSTSAVKTITAISSAVKVWHNGPMYIIDSPQAGIEAVNVFDLSGHKVAQVAGLGQNTMTLNLPANGSIMIVTCTLSNGQTASIKVMP